MEYGEGTQPGKCDASPTPRSLGRFVEGPLFPSAGIEKGEALVSA